MEPSGKNLARHFGWAVLLSEFSHVFCCVLPTVVTLLSLLANAGLMGAAPAFLDELHDALHAYEIPIIAFSGLMVALGWAFHFASRRVDCHDTGCVHPPCDSRKSGNSRILIIATVLFALNIGIYFGVHQNIFGFERLEQTDEHHH